MILFLIRNTQRAFCFITITKQPIKSVKSGESTPLTIDEQTKRLRRVDELVQQAEKTLQKIRAQHQRYQKQQANASANTSPSNSPRNHNPQSNAEKKSEEQRVPVTECAIEGLFMRDSSMSSLSIDDFSAGLKTPSEDSDEEVAVVDLVEKTPSPKKELRDVEVATVTTPLRDEAVSVTSEELVETRSVGDASSGDLDEGKRKAPERRVSFGGTLITPPDISRARETQTTTPPKRCDCHIQTEDAQPKLQLQKMPLVDIKGGMTIQKLTPIEIPSQPQVLGALRTDNVHYEEVAVSESKITQTECKESSSGTVTSSEQSLLRIARQDDKYEEVEKEQEPVVVEEGMDAKTFANTIEVHSDSSVEAEGDGKDDALLQRKTVSDDLLKHSIHSSDESNFPKETQETTNINKDDLVEDEIISVLDQIIKMRVTTDDESNKSTSLALEAPVVAVRLNTDNLQETTSTQYSLKCSIASSYEVLDASAQVSSSLLLESIDSDGSGAVEKSSKEWREVVFKAISSDDVEKRKKKETSSQSPQDMIDVLKKAVKEENVKAQESIKDFFQPTAEDLQRIRRMSQHFTKNRQKPEASDVSKTEPSESGPAPKESCSALSFLQCAQIDDTKTTALSSSPYFPKSLEKFVTPIGSNTCHEKVIEELQKQESSEMYETMAPFLPSKSILVTSEDKSVQSIPPIKIHPNGRYADEAEDFYQPPPPSSPIKICYNQRRCHTDTSESYSESLSEGEVKCKCNASIGELHLCKYARNSKGAVQYLKRNPDKLLQYETAEPGLEVVGEKRHYLNWVSYYVKRPAAT